VSDRTDKEAGQSAAEGYGSVIGPKQHFTSPEIKAYFQIDLERLRSYGLLDATVQAHILHIVCLGSYFRERSLPAPLKPAASALVLATSTEWKTIAGFQKLS
jgi:hypothetical protein